ncbi:MAG: hypothetical protein HW405_416 [Candidatus Berkelbacteria bacterium]|nr:hypothetical protein [Candidatus Berkelbacteria bacterium]
MTIKGLEAKVIAKNGKMVEIEIDGQKIKIPSEYLPASIGVGEGVNLFFSDSKNASLEEQKLAKAILNEILNGQ